jgi:hypothetical protein
VIEGAVETAKASQIAEIFRRDKNLTNDLYLTISPPCSFPGHAPSATLDTSVSPDWITAPRQLAQFL